MNVSFQAIAHKFFSAIHSEDVSRMLAYAFRDPVLPREKSVEESTGDDIEGR
jgi:hypothetical protein